VINSSSISRRISQVVAANPCSEMSGFTRLLASAGGRGDSLMDIIPTIVVEQAGSDRSAAVHSFTES